MAISAPVLERFEKVDWKGLLREDLGDSGNLKEASSNLDRLKDIFDSLLENPVLSDIPNHERTFETILNNFLDFCDGILVNYTDTTQKTQKIADIRQKEEEVINQLSPILNYVRFLDPGNQKKVQELEKTLKEAGKLITDVKIKSEESKKIAEKQEVSKYGKAFEDMAKKNGKSAIRNFIAMLLFLVITVVFACLFLWGGTFSIIEEGATLGFWENIWNNIITQNIVLKFFVLSAGGYLVSHFSRNFSAEKHLYYLNTHRQNALDSHQRILDSVSETTIGENDIETQNAILLQVTKTMFEFQDTGYLKGGNSPVPTTQIVENIISKK
jgi:NADH:ubiquinone oxidoreductase subunit 3 (subunit A)